MTNNHTPGPWTVGIADFSDAGNARYEISSNRHISAPDARLIAAAPDLLAALELMRDAFLDTSGSHGDYEEKATDAADAAIAKATGETS